MLRAMRRIIAAAAAFIITLSLTACSKEQEPQPKPQVLVLLDSYGQSHENYYESILNAVKVMEGSAEIVYEYYTSQTQLTALAAQNDIVVNFCYDALESLLSTAGSTPETKFLTVVQSDTASVPENCIGMYFDGAQGGFLAGAAAALKSTTDKVGVVTEQYYEKWYEGFCKGVAHVRPQMQIITAYTQNNSAYDEAKRLFESEGCDVVYCCADDNIGAADAAVECEKFVISTGFELYDYAPDNALYAVLDGASTLMTDMLGKLIADTAQLGVVNDYGIVEGGILLSPYFQNLSEQIYTEINNLKTELIIGNIDF